MPAIWHLQSLLSAACQRGTAPSSLILPSFIRTPFFRLSASFLSFVLRFLGVPPRACVWWCLWSCPRHCRQISRHSALTSVCACHHVGRHDALHCLNCCVRVQACVTTCSGFGLSCSCAHLCAACAATRVSTLWDLSSSPSVSCAHGPFLVVL